MWLRDRTAPWYDGPTVLGYLENIDDTRLAVGSELRFPVQHVPDPSRRTPHHGLRVRLKSTVTTAATPARSSQAGCAQARRWWSYHAAPMPWSKRSTLPTVPLDLAVAGQSVVIRLDSDIDISRGDIIAATDAPPAPIRDLTATVCWLTERELSAGARVLFQHGTSITSRRAVHRGSTGPQLRGRNCALLAADRLTHLERHRPGPAEPGLTRADRLLPRAPCYRGVHPGRRCGRLDPRPRRFDTLTATTAATLDPTRNAQHNKESHHDRTFTDPPRPRKPRPPGTAGHIRSARVCWRFDRSLTFT